MLFKPYYILAGLFLSTAYANEANDRLAEHRHHTTESDRLSAQALPTHNVSEQLPDLNLQIQKLSEDPTLTEQVLEYAMLHSSAKTIQTVLDIYRQFPQADALRIIRAEAQIVAKKGDSEVAMQKYRQILTEYPHFTPSRVQLALELLKSYQHNEAEKEFYLILQDKHLPSDIAYLIQRGQNTIKQRDRWRFTFSANYLRERNVNSASSTRNIEGTGFIKNESMLPQKANGVDYFLSAEKEVNLYKARYLHFSSSLNGKSYWDKHDYDELISRTYLGYVQKWRDQRLALLPFYERQWYANHRYKNTQGIRLSFNRWLNEKWQFATAMEYGKNSYYHSSDLNGDSKFISVGLHWYPTHLRSLSIGGDFLRENTRLRNYSYDLKTVRVSWTEQWGKQIISRLGYSYSERDYRDNLMLGRSFRFSRPRIDRIYQFNATLWKQDWQLPYLNLTPKLQFRWKKQRSTFASLYDYQDHSVNLVIEKNF